MCNICFSILSFFIILGLLSEFEVIDIRGCKIDLDDIIKISLSIFVVYTFGL